MAIPSSVYVENLGSAVRYSAIDEIPDLVIKIVADDIWREFTTKMNQHVTHDSFESFVTAEPLAGIGATVDILRRCCTGNTVALDALDQALQRPAHRPKKTEGNTPSSGSPEKGTRAQALRRLRKDRPDLHQEVLAGDLTPHRAMVQAGFRPPTFTVRADDPHRIAEALRRRLSQDQLAQLREELS